METTTETCNSSQRVSIGLLNDAVGKEIASSLQYIYFHVHFEDARYRYLSELMHRAPSPRCATSSSSPSGFSFWGATSR